MRTNMRRAAAAIVLAAVLGGIGATPLAHAAINTATFCAAVPQGQSGFTDIGSVAAQQRRDIECLAASGITQGKTATTYDPTGQVNRDQMATFVAKMVDEANDLEKTTLAALPSNPQDKFTDDENNVHENNINRLAAAGIVQGKTATTYDPGTPVNRAQMATFIVKALEYLRGTSLPTGTDQFTDDTGNAHEANINKLAGIDVVDGTGGTSYSPNSPVSRAQMASFIIRSLAWMHSEGLIKPVDPSQQSIAMSPANFVTNQTDNAAGDEVTYTASNIPVPDVDIRLFPCEAITSQNPLRYADSNPNDSIADPLDALVEADIVSVNGTAQAANTEAVSGVAVTNGQVVFTVDSNVADCVVPTVWDDADDDNNLDLDATDKPVERFGAGFVQFVPPAAPSGAMDENASFNDEANNTFIGCELNDAAPGAGQFPEQVSASDCFVFSYDANDSFFVDADNDAASDPGEAVTLDVFEQRLSTGDDVAGSYNATAGNQSSFVLVDESPGTSGNVVATAVDHDTINVSFSEVAGADAYRIYYNADPGPAACPAFTTTGADPYVVGATVDPSTDGDADTTNSGQVHNLDQNTRYCFSVTVVDESDESAATGQGPQSATSTQDTTPRAIDTELTTDSGAPNVVGEMDLFQICFDEVITDPTADTAGLPPAGDTETLVLRDGDGTTATISQNVNAIFDRGNVMEGDGILVAGRDGQPCAADRLLEVRIDLPPSSPSGGNGVLNLSGLTIQGPSPTGSEIEDSTGNQFNPAPTGQDLSIDVESGSEPN